MESNATSLSRTRSMLAPLDRDVRQARSIGSTLVIVDHELPERVAPGSHRLLGLGQVVNSIRLHEESGETECARCGEGFRSAGPTGHTNDEPICDVCLLECEEELVMVLALVARLIFDGTAFRARSYRKARAGGDRPFAGL